jgi:hypothetical protein
MENLKHKFERDYKNELRHSDTCHRAHEQEARLKGIIDYMVRHGQETNNSGYRCVCLEKSSKPDNR